MSVHDHIEPAAHRAPYDDPVTPELRALNSIAISLKRIADRLDSLSEPAAIHRACEILCRGLKTYGIGR